MSDAARQTLTGGNLVPLFFFAYIVGRQQAVAYIEAGGADGYIHVNAKAIVDYCRPMRLKSFDWDGAPVESSTLSVDWFDAKQEIRHWLLQAASKFDPFKGTKFSTWCMVHIKLKMRNLLSRVKKEKRQWKSFRTSGLFEIYAERKANGIPLSVALDGEDKALWDVILSTKDSWHRHITRNGISKKWKGDPAKLISVRTGIPHQKVAALFDRIREAAPEEIQTEPSHYRNGVRSNGRIFA